MNPKVSIVIPIYNCEKYLKNSIESAIEQEYDNLEVILIDDGSTDNSAIICKRYTEVPCVKYYKKENGGVSSARNLGIEKSTGKYIFFLDADDTISPGVINNLVKNQKVDTLCSSYAAIEDKKKIQGIIREKEYEANNAIENIITNKMQGYIWGYFFEKEKCPKFDERTGYCEDILFLIDYIKNNNIKKLEFSQKDQGVYFYNENDESITKRSSGVLKKLKDIETSMILLDEKTDKKYTKLINDKENLLFESEMQRIGKEDMKNVINLFTLPKYTGRSLRLKLFSNLYQKKNIKGLLRYYKLRNLGKRLVLKIKR